MRRTTRPKNIVCYADCASCCPRNSKMGDEDEVWLRVGGDQRREERGGLSPDRRRGIPRMPVQFVRAVARGIAAPLPHERSEPQESLRTHFPSISPHSLSLRAPLHPSVAAVLIWTELRPFITVTRTPGGKSHVAALSPNAF